MKTEFRDALTKMAEPKYRDFSSSLIPNSAPLLGVRLPKLRTMAKEICKGDFRSALDGKDKYFEEIMLRGFVIAYCKIDRAERLKLIDKFVEKIDNWSVCDSFCTTLKDMEKNPDFYIEYLYSGLNSKDEFRVRFSVVCFLDHYLKTKYRDEILDRLPRIEHQGFYVKTAIAWCLATAAIFDTGRVLDQIKGRKYDREITNMAIQKIVDSRRISEETKALAVKYRIKN